MFYSLRNIHRRGLAVMIIGMVLLIAACGDGKSDQQAISSSPAISDSQIQSPSPDAVDAEDGADASSSTRVYSSIMGDIEIPAEPKRIVTQGFLPYLLMFDIKPVGAPIWEIEYPHLAGMTDGIEDIGLIDGGSVETILALQPDLIITVAQEMYEQYSKIAPTVIIPYESIGDAHEDMRLFGDLLGKEEEAEARIKQFERKVEESKLQLQALHVDDETFTIIGAFDKTHYIYGDGIYRGGQAIYKYLELSPPPVIQKQVMDEDKDLIEISMEVIPEYAGDHIFLDVSNGAVFDEESSLWQSLPAVQNNKVYRMNTDIFWPYDPLAVEMQLDEVLKILQGAES